MREIVIQLAFDYPEMFRSRDGIANWFHVEIFRLLFVEVVGEKRKIEKEEDQARKMTDRVGFNIGWDISIKIF